MGLIVFIIAVAAAYFVWKKSVPFYIRKGNSERLSQWGGASVSLIVFMLILSVGLPMTSSDASTSNQNHMSNSREITRQELGDKWPFTYDKAVITCYKEKDIKLPVVKVNGKNYGLTGFADNLYGTQDINAINEVWLKDEDKGQGIYLDLSSITNETLKLCQ